MAFMAMRYFRKCSGAWSRAERGAPERGAERSETDETEYVQSIEAEYKQ